MKHLYLLLAIVGAVVPYLFFFEFFNLHGISLTLFVSALFANGAAAGFSADLLISSLVFWLFMFKNQQAHSPKPYLFIVLNLTIGLSCALPAYLYAKTKADSLL
ncbi:MULTISPECIES: DUF2834 domain-containing protein [unclassified Agarivorans]|uniref:DUF2834 domain-containing protein n=1 Tax=unclassified Agarivorans TaxID=2636026 RepID=UPI0010ED8C13|nr:MULTISPECIES: DUF2834 domain-containing protein [unclassified Agarivorans]MDO6687033.1 DUF2834 domain-containing protein [Agarivorans sp. 3_MG-2023]MDO6713555.1 DUF2834 domain-containing protein [Agarivorans sp. 2_MG-2023]GDY27993.1 hypothetical protein AHAT_38830 [Agarivorans sp. Toyoura001]